MSRDALAGLVLELAVLREEKREVNRGINAQIKAKEREIAAAAREVLDGQMPIPMPAADQPKPAKIEAPHGPSGLPADDSGLMLLAKDGTEIRPGLWRVTNPGSGIGYDLIVSERDGELRGISPDVEEDVGRGAPGVAISNLLGCRFERIGG